MKQYFPDDTYTTATDTRGMILDWLLLRSRWALYLKIARVVLDTRKPCLAGRFHDAEWADSSYRAVEIIERCGGRFEIAGLDNIRKLKAPVVLIGNHMSTLETLVLPALIAPLIKVTFVVKEKLIHGPAFGPLMRSRNPITVGRMNPRADLESVLTGGKKRLEQGWSVIIFPQSTRREIFRREQFNSLGIKLALHAGVDVLPFALMTDFWSNGKYLKGFGKLQRKKTIHIVFGSEMKIAGRGKEEHQWIMDFVADHIVSWGGAVANDREPHGSTS